MPISEPGFYTMTAEEYHADPVCVPSLSRSLAHTLVDKSPAHARAEHPTLGMRPPSASSDEMDFGEVAHSLLLGSARRFDVWSEKTWRGKEAEAFWDKALAAKRVPILEKTLKRAEEMAEVARTRIEKLGFGNPFNDAASELKNETVAVWQERDIWCRAMLDAPRLEGETIFDIKTTISAHPKAVVARLSPMGYDMQDIWYRRAVTTLRPLLAGRLRFVFFFIESHFPYAVTPVEMNGMFKTIAQSRVERAVELWRRCLAENHWPAYTDKTIIAEPKPWALTEEFGADSATEAMKHI